MDVNEETKADIINEILARYRNVPDMIGVELTGIHVQTPYGDSLLHLASIAGDLEALSFLVESGADVNQTGASGMTPLHYAAQQNQLKAAELLLKLGANPYMIDEAGEMPLEWAAALEHSKLCDLIESYRSTDI